MRYAALDGWRGACALMVAIYHFNTNTEFAFNPIIRNSFLFVEFFFLLSGFVICHAYANKIDGKRELIRYFLKRLARLWPLHIVLLFCMVPIAAGQYFVLGGQENERFSIESFVANVFLIQALGIFDTETWNIVSWSISVELFTCLLFGVVTIFTRSVWVYLLLSAIGGTVLYNVYGSFYDTYHFAWFRGLYGFFLGCVIYRCYEVSYQKIISTMGKVGFSVLELAALSAVLLFLSWVPAFGPFYLAPLVFSAAVLVFAFDGGVLSQAFRWHPFQQLGLYSYSIYLVHGFLIAVIKGGLTVVEKWFGVSYLVPFQKIQLIDLGTEWLNLLATVVYVMVLYGIASVTYKMIEKPGQDWMRHRLNRTKNQ